ncbi:MAG: hypothetical protein HOP03_17280 [Lysobacter sp.]|nr:hypothetical protein [Lysobacter sp.]
MRKNKIWIFIWCFVLLVNIHLLILFIPSHIYNPKRDLENSLVSSPEDRVLIAQRIEEMTREMVEAIRTVFVFMLMQFAIFTAVLFVKIRRDSHLMIGRERAS